MSKYKHKYFPETKEELKKLVDNKNICLGEINTSKITNMSGLFYNSKRKDFTGEEYKPKILQEESISLSM